MSDDAFSLLAEPIQRILWRMKWTALRPIQVDCIRKVLTEENDIIVSARTASGKTEAAFLPILSYISENRADSVQALYVGPLKALINDQFRRLEELCEYAEIPTHRWHGDVAGTKKRKLTEEPSGVLLITPESLESLFVNWTTRLRPMFRNLAYVVIDELHAFLGCERGTHLRSLLHRLNRYTTNPYRMIALSATLGDTKQYADWMVPTAHRKVDVVTDSEEQANVRYKLSAYLKRRIQSDGPERDDHYTDDMIRMTEDMYGAFRGSTNLIFANSKSHVEMFADLLNQRCRESGTPDEFLVHHGSLSKVVREQTEELMRGRRPCTTICSSSLELGIDIGNVASVGQIGAPWSVTSLVQRLGRSGRGEGEPSVMRVYVTEREPEEHADLVAHLYSDLLQAIALTELMLEKWVEPPTCDTFDFSTFLQQILSVLKETGGITAHRLYDRLIVNGHFKAIDRNLFGQILRAIGKSDLIEQMPEGDLILGLVGEQVVGHFSFYSAFATPEEYRVTHDGKAIGTLPAMFIPDVEDHVILAARRWEVIAVYHDGKEIVVKPARGKKLPRFTGSAGNIHSKVRHRMQEVLLSNDVPRYLNHQGCEMLSNARRIGRQAGIDRTPMFETGEHSCIWFTWTGTKAQRTLILMALHAGLDAMDLGIAIQFNQSSQNVLEHYKMITSTPPSAIELAQHVRNKQTRKYDEFLDEELLVRSLAEDALDVEEARVIVERILKQIVTHAPRIQKSSGNRAGGRDGAESE